VKVLQVIDQLQAGGAERVAIDLSILLKNEDVDIDFLNLLQPAQLDKELKKNNIHVTYLNRKNKYNPFLLLKLFFLLNTYSVIHVHSRHVLRYVGLTFFIPTFLRKYKVVFHDHYGNIEMDKTISYYLKKCIKNCNAYIGVSDKLVAWAEKKRLNNSIYLLENIVREKKSVKKINTKSEIIVVGNFREQKNYEFLMSILEKLPVNVSMDLYGAIVDREYYEKIVEQVRNLGLSNQINIIENETNITALLINYKMAVHCAASETGPLVAIEYMSQHIPFIMFNTGSVAKKLKEHKYDLIMDTFHAEKWSEKIESVLQNKSYFERLKKEIRLLYSTSFSEKKYISTCMEIYQNILHS
tara:strand:- start:29508 stop:30572 length:1065 start_codon:yes stop_codon:yes gene_type:complete